MQSLLIVPPLKGVVSNVASAAYADNLARMTTPDPKEAARIVSTGASITLDFGAPVTADSAFIGWTTGLATTEYVVGTNSGNPNDGITERIAYGGMGDFGRGMTPNHVFQRASTPQTSRYWQFQFGAQVVDYSVGVISMGFAWQAEWGHEWGAGRTIEDTGSSERLFGGGWATDDGVAASGYQWTFGDLQPVEVDKLYAIVKDRRTTRSLLVVEDPEQTDGLNERLHWGLFRKLDAYERLDPQNTKWSLQIGDWA